MRVGRQPVIFTVAATTQHQRSNNMRSSILLLLATALCIVAATVLVNAEAPAHPPPYSGLATHAVVETCRGCRLNSLPMVKEFVYNKNSGAESYERCTVKFIQGKSPELIFYQDAAEVERIPLDDHSIVTLYDIMTARGFKQKPVPLTAEVVNWDLDVQAERDAALAEEIYQRNLNDPQRLEIEEKMRKLGIEVPDIYNLKPQPPVKRGHEEL